MEVRVSERTIAFVLYPGVTLLDLVGPLEVLSKLPPPYRAVVVSSSKVPMDTSLPLEVVAHKTYEEVPHPYAIIVPGGSGGAIRAMGDQRLRDYLLEVDRTASAVGSVCTGSLILAAAGLLDGRNATTHWSYASFLERLGARYVRKRWVRDGRYITSAGVSAGIDMALQFASELVGSEAAGKIQIGLEYEPEPPLGPIDWEKVDIAEREGRILDKMRSELAHRPDLLARLGIESDRS
ncbi:MAG: DJ-1/PfpI family protein [Methanomassiliicoccus sp.]|nr:DJ-1/PfpI family protein [Methanomassiliicoccus sp.]